MKFVEQHIKSWLFRIIIIILFIPLVQQKTDWMHVHALFGISENAPYPFFSKETWLSEEYQKQKDNYLNQNFGFRNWLVRLNNQITYSIYGQVHCSNVVVGKNNQLYQDFYIDGYDGKDFIGKDVIKEKCFKLKKIQDTLSKKGINFLVLLAPGKADFFPEYIPDQYKEILDKKLPTNYQFISAALNEKKINTIDFNKWYMEHKNKTDFPLYPQGGVHWSVYGAAFAADTLIENMKRISGKNYIDIKIKKGEMRDTIPVPDRELTDGMNLMFPLPAYKTAYPNVEYDTAGKIKPNVLTISDSYINNLSEVGLIKYGFSDQSLNFESFNMAHSMFTNNYIYVNLLDVQKEIESRDFVIIITTVPNLNRFGWGFIESVYDIYYNTDSEKQKERQIKYWEDRILHTPEWIENIKQKANKEGHSLEIELRANAEYMIYLEKVNKKK